MAKKVRKPRARRPRTYSKSARRRSRPSQATVERDTQAAVATPQTRRARGKATSLEQRPVRKAGPVDFASEYHYVVSDLRRMFTLAGIMVVVLIVLNFIVQ